METTVGPGDLQRGLPRGLPVPERARQEEGTGRADRPLCSHLRQEGAGRDPRRRQGHRLHVRDASRGRPSVSRTSRRPTEKPKILAEHEKRAEKVEAQYTRGVITEDERRQELIEIWTEATERGQGGDGGGLRRPQPDLDDGRTRVPEGTSRRSGRSPVCVVSWRTRRGEIIPRPIRANFREGLTVLEYFISTHGARKGLADTALRTADSGYLTRRLVDVAQEVMVRAEDCGTDRGIRLDLAGGACAPQAEAACRGSSSRTPRSAKKVVAPAGDGDHVARSSSELIEAGVEEVVVRSVLMCDVKVGVCQQCYGISLATGRPRRARRGGRDRRRPVDR